MNVDKSIISRCKKYDKNAFLELFRLYENYLYKLCYSYVQNEQDALDISQEVYIKIFKNIGKFDEKMPFHPWFRKVAVNTCLNYKRTINSNVVSMNGAAEDETPLEDLIAAGNDVEAEVEGNDLGRIIKDHLNELSPKHRMVIILRYYEDLTYEEIANILKEPLGTVKTNLYRARNILKSKLAGVV